MTTAQALIPIEQVNGIELFTKDGLPALLTRIEHEVAGFVPDLSTAAGRKEIAATAYKVARSKTVIDAAGKELVSGWKNQAKEVDLARRQAREYLDNLRDRIRQPLTDYEAEQLRKAEDERLAAELKATEIEAYAEHDVWLREQVVKEKEAELAKLQTAAERAAREETIRKEAEEQARREAAKTIQRERQRAEQAERDAAAAAERERAQAEQAEQDKQEAVERERRRASEEAEAIERERLQHIEDEKRADRHRASDREIQRRVNSAIVTAFVTEGIPEETAKIIVRLVVSGHIPSMEIRY